LPSQDMLAVRHSSTALGTKPHSLYQALLLQEHLNDSVLCSRIFLLYTPLP